MKCLLLAITALGGPFTGVNPSFAQSIYTPYTFTTIAGSAGYGSADGTNSAARFGAPDGLGPIGVAVDSAGNLYVSDSGNATIRKVTPVGTDWVVTTLAGMVGQNGSADGTNGAARFNDPTGLAVDSQGNLYLADEGNYTIRKLTPSGTNWVVTTLAGLAGKTGSANGTGNSARFGDPRGLAVDAAGNVYVADAGNNTLRKVTPAGAVTTLAGLAGASGSSDGTGSAARFNLPRGVSVDTEGNLYVADGNNNTIRKVAPSGTSWVVTTLAGLAGASGTNDGTGASARFNYPAVAVVDSAGNLYVGDSGNETIRKMTLSGTNWTVTTLAGLAGTWGSADGTGSAARFYGHCVLAVDGPGNIYMADTYNYAIRKVTPAGVVTTLAGEASTGSANGTGGTAKFNLPQCVAVDSIGNLYVADTQNSTIRRVTPSGTNWVVTTLAGLAGVTGSDDGTGESARFYGPSGVAVDGVGNVYVADTYNSTIRQVTPSGVVTTLAGLPQFDADGNPVGGRADGTGSDARFAGPSGVAVDSAGNLFVADSGNNTIRKVTPSGTNWVVTTLAGSAYVTNQFGGAMGGSADGTNGAAQFNYPAGLAVDSAGNLYVADSGNNTIREVAPTGTNWVVTTLAGKASTVGGRVDGTNSAARFSNPSEVAVDGAGNLYVADEGNYTIRKMTPVGTNWVVTTLAGLAGSYGSADGTGSAARFGNGASGIGYITGVAADGAGNVYVADEWNNTIRKGYLAPMILISGAAFGFTAGQFGFDLTGPSAQFVIVEASTDLSNWLPIWTNTFGANALPFTDPQAGLYPHRFYRARLP